MKRSKKLMAGTILFLSFLFFMARLPPGLAAPGRVSSMQKTTYSSSLGDEPQSSSLFESRFFIAVVWPVAFVVLEVTLTTLASARPVRAVGDRNFRVWYKDTDDSRIETSTFSR